ncbi:4622_t:CDS:1 [Ambispora gerdemannii]|uniref:4622_t:CDS:1 n=1 Tax=Ambispora gerdemannii TaxID=144530 RepID=A0A9N8ZLT6_9GLOM|nr:4622_t:CDS:1 [Ambispora gerdemannii]
MTITSIITTTSILDIVSTMSEYDKKMFHDPPYKLLLSMDKLLAPAKRTRKNKKDLNSPRQQNQFIIFRKNYDAKLRLLKTNAKFQDISKECGAEWRSQPSEVKKYFDLLQRIAFKIHKLMYPSYQYSPKKKESVFRGDNDELYEYDEDDAYAKDDENNNSNNNRVALDPSSINVSSSSSSNSATINLTESSSFYTPIDTSFDIHLNGPTSFILASSLTQDPITMPEDSLSSSNELNPDYNYCVDTLGITINNNNLRNFTFDSSILPNYTEDAGTSIDTDISNEIILLDQTNNPLICAENNYLFAETNGKEIIDNSIDIIPVDKFVFAESKESFESNVNDNNSTNIIIATTNTLTSTTISSIVPNASSLISPLPQFPFITEYLSYDSTSSAGDLSKITFNDSPFDKFA